MKRRITILISLILACLPVRAAVELRSERLTTTDGLADNSVRQILQDNKGFLWMATLNGLSRYDGNAFVNFYPKESEAISLADHRIRSLMEDRNGFLWVSTYADIFNCYDLKNDRFVDFSGCGEHTRHYNMAALQGDDVWVWGKWEGCMRVSYKNGTFTSESFGAHNKTLPSNNVLLVKEGSHGEVYIITDKGWFAWNKGTMKSLQQGASFFKLISYKGDDVFVSVEGGIWINDARNNFKKVGEIPVQRDRIEITGVLNIRSKCLFFTSGGTYSLNLQTRRLEREQGVHHIPNGIVKTDNLDNYWVHNKSGNLYYIQAETGETKLFPLALKNDKEFANREQYHIWHDSRNIIWITTYGSGLFAYTPATQELQQFTADNGTASHIESNFLQNIMEDRSGSIWVSSEFSGVSRLSVINEGATRIYPEGSNDTNLNTVRMVVQTGRGDVWLGTRNGGLYLYNSDFSVQKKKYYDDFSTYAIYEDKDGHVWKGTRRSALYVDNRLYQNVPADSTSLSYDAIYTILGDKQNRIWVGTFGGGLNLAVPGKSGYTFRRFLNGEYGQRWIRCLIEDQNGWIWAGTSGGVFVFRPDKLLANPKDYHGYDKAGKFLKSDEIRSIMQDSKGRVWIAESGTGFSMCAPGGRYNQLTFTHYSTADGLVSNMVQAFAEDAQGMIWISTQYGISCFNPETRVFENYFFSDFMQGNIYCENSAFKLADGRLAFGSNQGLVVIDTEKVGRRHNATSVTFTDLKLNGISVRPGDPDSPLQSALAYSQAIQLKYYQNSFAIEVSTLDYSDANLPRFSYRLENYESEWSVPSPLNFAAYKNLSPGTYYLHVKSCNTASVWGEQEAVLKIVITPPFWKTGWAFLLYTVLLIGLLYVVFRTVRNMSSLRTRIKIEEQLTEYKLVFFTNISHEFRTPLTLIQGALEKIQRIDTMPREAAKPLQTMEKNSQRMLRLINQLLEFRKMQNNKLALSLEETDVIGFLYEIFLSFNDVAEQKSMTFRFQSPLKSYKMFIDKGKLDKVAYNLLSNAFKYTPSQGTVTFSIQIDEEKKLLEIKVSDNGVGIPKEKQNELFKRFMQSSFSGDSIGVGLHLSHELVSVHQGTIIYKENEGGGSVFTVAIPTDKAAYNEKDFLISGNVLLQEADELANVLAKSSEEVTEPEHEQEVIPLNKRKVLVIEDDADIRSLLKEEIGVYFEVEVAVDGIEGLEKAQAGEVDLIICDVMMPGMTGFDVTRKLKTTFATSHIPIILLTALSSQENQLEGIDAGADAYISKPFSIKYLLARALKLIEQRDRLREKFSKEPGITHTAICSTNRDKKFADRLATVLEENITRADFSVEEFATLMKLSRTAFYTKVRGITGYSPVEYLRIVRLKKAAELLLSEDTMNVAEIAYKVGFNDPFYFSKCFKGQFGVSPSTYQKGGGTAAPEPEA